jgi:glycine/D-amino acid oxidase-like deaminating enzyme
MRSFDLIIVGAGIVGCACALECTRAGMRVGIVEGGAPAGAATGAAMGHIVVMDDSPAQLALTRYSQSLWQQMSAQLPAAVEYKQRGTVWVAASDEEMHALFAKREMYASARVESHLLDAQALAEAEPNLRAGLAGGLRVPNDAVIDPPVAAAFFLQEAARGGTLLLQGYAADGIANGTVTLTDGSAFIADRIIVATGADTALLPWLPIRKRKGHLLITGPRPGFLHHQLVELAYLKSTHDLTSDSVAFNIQPRLNGQLLIGSSRQFGNEDPAIDQNVLHAMVERARSFLPALADVPGVHAWTGFRAATPDKLPLIGPTNDPAIYLAVGFEGLGITNSLAAARLLVDSLLQREPEIDATPFLPSRFAALETKHKEIV